MKTTITTKLSGIAQAIRNFFSPADRYQELYPPAALQRRDAHIQALLLHLCAGDELRALWVKRWLALPLRSPGAKLQTALIVNDGQGSGKSLFFQQVAARLHGDDARCIPDIALRSCFNAWALDQPRLIIVEGTLTQEVQARLKYFVSADSVLIEQKARPTRVSKSMMNFVFVSGNPDPLPASVGNRRFFVLDVPPSLPASFYRAAIDEIADGGIDAFKHHLMHELDMGKFDAHTPMPRRANEAKEAA